jgi:hypothetical protein
MTTQQLVETCGRMAVAHDMSGQRRTAETLRAAADRLSEMDAENKRLKSEVEFLHLRRGQLVIERDKVREALTDLVSWFTLPMISGKVWIIPAGERGADDAVNAARAALEQQQQKGEGL